MKNGAQCAVFLPSVSHMEFNIASYLEKFKKLGLNQAEAREEAAKAASEELGVPIDPSSISFKDGTLVIAGSPALKSSLLMKKEAILNRLSTLCAQKHISKIR